MNNLEILDGISPSKNAPSDFPTMCNFVRIKYDNMIVTRIAGT